MIRNLSSATFLAIFCLAALPGAANAAVIHFGSGDVTSGSFGNSHIAAGDFTDVLAFETVSDWLFSASLTSAATQVGKPGDVDFSTVRLTGPDGPFNFKVVNNDSGDGLTDSAVFTGPLKAGAYLLTISGHSYGNGQYGGNTTVQGVPEPASWAMFIGGFGLAGAAMRRRKTAVSFG